MNRLHTSTRGLDDWRMRLARPDRHWRREFSAFEAAVSWERASKSKSGIPQPILDLLKAVYGQDPEPALLVGVAEHQVRLLGGNRDSQSDVWGLVSTAVGTVSMAVEAKAKETFGNQKLGDWLQKGSTDRARRARKSRWDYLHRNLPSCSEERFSSIAYQLLHRCASAVIEARRFKLKHAACVVQAFRTPENRFPPFADFCGLFGISAARGAIHRTTVDEIELAIGWADCPIATDAEIAKLASVDPLAAVKETRPQ